MKSNPCAKSILLLLILCLSSCAQQSDDDFLSLRNHTSEDYIAIDVRQKIMGISQSKVDKNAKHLSLFEAWENAKEYAASHQVEKYRRDALQEPQEQIKARLLPQISLNSHYNHRAPYQEHSHKSYGFDVQLAQAIYDPLLWRKYQAEKINAQMGDTQLKQHEDHLLLDVAQAYFDILIAQDKLSVIAKEKMAYQAQIQQLEGKFKLGQATALDILDAQSHYDAAVSREVKIKTELIVAQNTLENQTGWSIKDLSHLESLDVPILKTMLTEEQWLEKALENNIKLKQKHLEFEKAIADKKVIEAEYYPQLSLTMAYQDSRNHLKSIQPDTKNSRNKGAYIGLQFHLPLFSGGETHSKIRQYHATIRQKEEEYRAEAEKVVLDVKQKFALLEGYQAQIKAQEQLYQTHLEKLKAAKLGNEYGMSYPLEILQAEKDLAEARSGLAEARYQYYLTEIKLLQLVGALADQD